MTDRELMQMALDAMEEINRTGDTQVFDMCVAPKLIPALRERLSQPEPDPVAYVSGYHGGNCVVIPTNPAVVFSVGTAFSYTAPVHASDISQERVDETAKYGHDCNKCENRGCVLVDSQESYCENCIYGSPWKKDYYKEKNT